MFYTNSKIKVLDSKIITGLRSLYGTDDLHCGVKTVMSGNIEELAHK